MSVVALVPLLPLLAALVIGVRMATGSGRDEAGEAATARIAVLSTLAALLLLVGLDAAALFADVEPHVVVGHWLASGQLSVPVSFLLDGLSLPIATLVALIAYLAQRFSVNYLHREPGFHRFFFGMSLFTAGMLLIVLSGSAVLTFAGWELAGVSSYLLIGYAYDRRTATGNAQRAFVTNRIGDAGFLLGIILAMLWLGSVEWNVILGEAGRLDSLTAGVLAVGFIIAAAAKSAQVPFAPWVARALEGPTPSSAIFYGSLMIHAGVYLIIRIGPLLEHSPAVMALLAAIGLLTALYGWLSGLVQTDVKSSLMFATTTQVGLMFLACGLGWFELAAWHLALHAGWRAYQFLISPSYLELTEQPVPRVGGRLATSQWLYTAAVQRFWLEAVADWLLVRPTRALGRDVNRFDQSVVSRLVGLPEESGGNVQVETAGLGFEVAQGHGAAGRLLQWSAERLNEFERHLIIRGGGRLSRFLARAGSYLLVVESLLERPRYLLLLIMATLVVIL